MSDGEGIGFTDAELKAMLGGGDAAEDTEKAAKKAEAERRRASAKKRQEQVRRKATRRVCLTFGDLRASVGRSVGNRRLVIIIILSFFFYQSLWRHRQGYGVHCAAFSPVAHLTAVEANGWNMESSRRFLWSFFYFLSYLVCT